MNTSSRSKEQETILQQVERPVEKLLQLHKLHSQGILEKEELDKGSETAVKEIAGTYSVKLSILLSFIV